MTDDTVTRLRVGIEDMRGSKDWRVVHPLLRDAADEIERLRLALEDIAQAAPLWPGGIEKMPHDEMVRYINVIRNVAREALE